VHTELRTYVPTLDNDEIATNPGHSIFAFFMVAAIQPLFKHIPHLQISQAVRNVHWFSAKLLQPLQTMFGSPEDLDHVTYSQMYL
jgi:hypothetical protein